MALDFGGSSSDLGQLPEEHLVPPSRISSDNRDLSLVPEEQLPGFGGLPNAPRRVTVLGRFPPQMVAIDLTQVVTKAQRLTDGDGPSASGQPYWEDDPDSWDTMKIGGAQWPGLVKISGGIKNKKQVKTAPGAGTVTTHIAYAPAELSLTLRLWTLEHWQAFQDTVVPQIRPKRNAGPPLPYSVFHPALSVYGITAIEFIEASFPKESDTPGVFEIEIKALEYLPPSQPVSTPKNAGALFTAKNFITPKANSATGTAPVVVKPSSNSGPNG